MSNDSNPALAQIRNQFDIVGELGQDGDGGQTWLARERNTSELVAVRVEPATDPQNPRVVVSRMLSSSVPAAERACPICKTQVTDWRRFCHHCGTDLSGSEADSPDVEAAAASAGQHVELIGRMQRAEGGGAVYFAQNRQTGEIVALDLKRSGAQPGDTAGLAFQVTSVLKAPGAPAADTGPASAAAEPPAAASPQPHDAAGSQVKVCPACGMEFDPKTRFCPVDGSVLRLRSTTDSLLGSVIAERYHVTRLIGQGGMGQVYLAEHVKMGRPCAIKVMNRQLSHDVGAVARFTREAANASRINDDNVAHIYDFGETPEHGIYLAMEYVDGLPLGQIIRREAPLSAERVIHLGMQIAKALMAAHREAVVHRDLTPNNVMVTATAEGVEFVKVVDFGIAKAMQDDGGGLTRTGFVVGTPQYMSPEQLMAGKLDGRSDIYSLGIILYEMLTGQPPFGGSAPEHLTRRLTEDPPHARDVNAAVPAALDAVVHTALARDPGQRYGNAQELREALERAGVAPPEPERVPWFRRRKSGQGAAAPEATTSGRRTIAGSGATPARTQSKHKTSGTGAPEAAGRTPPAGEAAPARTGGAGGTRGTGPRPATAGAASTGGRPLGSGRTPVPEPPDARAAVGYDDATLVVPSRTAEEPARGRAPLLTRKSAVRGAAAAALLAVAGTVYGTLVEPIRIGPVTLGFGRTAAPPALQPDPLATEVQPPSAGGQNDAPASTQPPAPTGVRLGAELPAGAVIRANGQIVDVAGDFITLGPGTHDLELSAAGFTGVRHRVTLAESQSVTWTPRLERVVAEAAPPAQQARQPRADSVPVQTLRPNPTVPDPVATQNLRTQPVSFASTATDQIDGFRRSLESKDLGSVRRFLTQAVLTEFDTVLRQAGSAPIQVTVYDLVPDSAGNRATFLLRIDERGGRNLMGFREFEAEFIQASGIWQLFAVQRRQ